MQYLLNAPASLYATVQLPASKSISNRALILHALSGGSTRPENLSDCDDTQVMIRALDHMPDVIDIHAAGTAMRFLTAYLCVTPGTHTITGTERMQQRPIRILVDALRTLGARIDYAGNEGFPPLCINGTQLTGSEIELAGNVSSQYISALLMIGAVLPVGLKAETAANGQYHLTSLHQPDAATDARLRRTSRMDIGKQHRRDTRRLPRHAFPCGKRLERSLLLVPNDSLGDRFS